MIAPTAVRTEVEVPQAQDIATIISRRSDLSTFIVHLTREDNGERAKDRLKSIVSGWRIEARNPHGSAVRELQERRLSTDSQKCVCFTETPLEYLHLLLGQIKDRTYQFAPYGVAVTKKLARKAGVNPVWYVDMTPGGKHDWLTNHIDKLRDSAVSSDSFEGHPVAKITPFIEHMGTWPSNSNRKEFWWEREWRHVGDFNLPDRVLLICPETDFSEFEGLAKKSGHRAKCIDPQWGLEQIIARLAGFDRNEIEIL